MILRHIFFMTPSSSSEVFHTGEFSSTGGRSSNFNGSSESFGVGDSVPVDPAVRRSGLVSVIFSVISRLIPEPLEDPFGIILNGRERLSRDIFWLNDFDRDGLVGPSLDETGPIY